MLFVLFQYFKFISNAPNRFEYPLIAHALKLFAKALNMYVNCSGVTQIIKSPNLVKELISCENTVSVVGEEIEKLQLLWRNVYWLTAELKLIFLKTDFNVFEFYYFAICFF